MRTTATDKIGPWLHERVRARQKAVLTRRVAAIGVNAANGLQHRRIDMARSEIAALLHAWKKSNGMIRDGLRVVAHGQPIGRGLERISRKWKCSAGGHAGTGPWAN